MGLYFVHYVGYHIDILVSKRIKQGKIKKKEYRYKYFKQLLFKIFTQAFKYEQTTDIIISQINIKVKIW